MIEAILSAVTGIEDWILAASSSVWVFPVLFGLVVLDGLFPPIPSESAVIALAVVAVTPEGPNLALVILVAGAGAWAGDLIAYELGRLIGTERIPFLRGARGRRVVSWTHSALTVRGASFILATRFIPIGRVGVSVAAGAVRFARSRFALFTAIGSLLWAAVQALVGIVAATWLENSTLLAMAGGIVIGLLLGVVLDKVLSAFAARKAAAGARITTYVAAPVESNGQVPY